MIEITAVFILVLCAVPLIYKYPESALAFFLVAGFFKADPRVQAVVPAFLDLTLFFGACSVLGFFIRLYKSRFKIDFLPKDFFVPYCGLAIVMLASLFYTSGPGYGSDKVLRFFTMTALAAFGPVFLMKDKRSTARFFGAILFVSTIMVLETPVSYATPAGFQPVMGVSYLAVGRITGISSLALIYYFLPSADGALKKMTYIFFWPLIFLRFFITAGGLRC